MNESFKALADPTRREILRMLRERDMSAGEIAEHFNMSKPSISHHLNALKHAQLILDDKQGQHIIYSLNTTVVQEVMGWFMEMLNSQSKGEKKK